MAQQTVLITGAGIGIGRASALALARAGYRVVVTDILEREGRAAADAIAAQGGAAEFHTLDVRSTEAMQSVVARIEAAHGALGAVVANAGIAHNPRSPNSPTRSGTHDRHRSQRRIPHDPRGRPRDAAAPSRRSCHRPLLDHGRCVRLGRARPLFGTRLPDRDAAWGIRHQGTWDSIRSQ
jgi:NAD(P)-dependent dehydrogenase (short-subunit alcohol dehydrogenase family)